MSSGSGSARRLVLRAAAKVNLVLEVLGRRADGYHEISTIMQAVDLSDHLVLEEASTLELCTGAGVPTDDTNLALRAAHALGQASGVIRGARIVLDKRIPVAAGLGGGSADAAAVLVGLNRLWRLYWSRARLAEVALTLGMDVPFFLTGGTAWGTGRGERLRPIEARAMALVLVNPRQPSSTATAYGRLTPAMFSDGSRTRTLLAALRTRRVPEVAAALHNTLEEAVRPLVPAVGRIETALRAAGALGAVMSGSGSTVLGVARSFEHARQIRSRLTRASWDCWAVRTVRGPAVRVVGHPPRGRAEERSARTAGRRRALGRGQAARRGTLDPVFGGSNPPAPTTRGTRSA